MKQNNFDKNFEISSELAGIQNTVDEISVMSSECIQINQSIIEDYDVYKNVYVQNEFKEINELLTEAYDKLENMRDLFLMDKFEGCGNYEELTKNRIDENETNRQFMDIFGPYMTLFHLCKNNTE